MVVRIIDPQDMADFMERFKTETAHAVNRLLGRKKRTIWCEGYDSPLLEDVETVKDKIAYLYENPSKDGLVDSVERYPGVSSWQQLSMLTPRTSSKRLHETRFLPRDAFEALPVGAKLGERDYERIRRKLIHKRKKNHFSVDCNAWMKRFEIFDAEAQHILNQEIIDAVNRRELINKDGRIGKPPLGRRALVETSVGTPYVPQRQGKKMLLHSLDREFRKEKLRGLREIITEGRRVLECWRIGDMGVRYPLGLFPPSGIRLAEAIDW
jgi:hypothetical protein